MTSVSIRAPASVRIWRVAAIISGPIPSPYATVIAVAVDIGGKLQGSRKRESGSRGVKESGRRKNIERNPGRFALRDVKRPFARPFEDLQAWQMAHGLALDIYRLTALFPKTETYGLAVQARRAAVSIPANIAEGFRKRGRADKVRFLNIAQGSLEETRYYLILARDLRYCDPTAAFERIASTSRLLDGYLKGVLNSAADSLSPRLPDSLTPCLPDSLTP